MVSPSWRGRYGKRIPRAARNISETPALLRKEARGRPTALAGAASRWPR
jgi:hypothetical protein